ncbi:DUF6002 family protein [Streptomyces sp. 891-h]|uniref:DUF6002 family protein n=1 Tax=Streptomyces sp. 891-h TaxID=2720714 RepID=UPI001FAA9172|nr:DUF6002 family protein [Streptomyces sp. 891-h]UNZ19903.1 hypothetical protein HC362_25525 [Streptomyces sp. 891-h]
MTLTARTGPAASRQRTAPPNHAASPNSAAPTGSRPLTDHWDTVRTLVRALHERAATPAPPPPRDAAVFTPDGELPPLDGPLRAYLSAAAARVVRLPDHRGTRLHLLDLCAAPEARSAQSAGALLVVARAVHHARCTGERIALLAPSSGNAATALRDAVLRAQRCGLAHPDQVRVVALVPAGSRHKVADSALARHPELRRRNPLVFYHGSEPGSVHELAAAYCRERAHALRTGTGAALWYVRDPVDHRAADALRAFVEREALGAAGAGGRAHAQAVATGSGLLGHRLGSTLLEPDGTDGAGRTGERDGRGGAAGRNGTPAARYLLVQQLHTPDLVLHLLTGSFSREGVPPYAYDRARRLHHQPAGGTPDPHFPRTAHHPQEILDPTFFTRAPATAPELSALVRTHGGDGIVVSRYECLARYPSLRAMLRPAGVELPADPARLGEWSLVMALTGVLNALDRGLLTEPDVVVHGTGSYGVDDRPPVPDPLARYADSVDELHAVLTRALSPRGRRS